MSLVLLGFFTVLLSAMGAVLVWRAGHLLGLIDRPNERSSHHRPTPKGGGVGILAAFCYAAWALGFSPAFWVGPALLSLLSLYGDKIHLSFKLRLLAQFAAALWFLQAIYPLAEIRITPIFVAYLAAVAVFIVGTANFYNFMDGINGIAGGTGVVGFGLLSWFAHLDGEALPLVALPLMLSFACLAFLPFNLPKAKVFMGDVSSILLGFIFAGLVMKLADEPAEFLALVGCLFPFYADELSSMLARKWRGESLVKAHRSHLYQVLANEGKREHLFVSALFWLLQLFIGLMAIELRGLGWVAELIYLGSLFLLWAALARQIKKRLVV
ncbi:MAG: glycosyltransferase family 4 protein [bacterium]|nr:glycosyltransferase family 4 protein [bacterium]